MAEQWGPRHEESESRRDTPTPAAGQSVWTPPSNRYRIAPIKSANEDGSTGSYSMRLVTRLTGLSADTIRAWERRHGAVRPQRSEGNTRYFSDEDVRRLVLLRRAVATGHRIGQIASHTEEQLQGLVDAEPSEGAAGPVAASTSLRPLRKRYFEAVERFDSSAASAVLSRAAALLDRDDLLFDLIVPILHETGERWEAGELLVAHEHFVSAQVRWLLDTILRHGSPSPGAPSIVVATPPGERHEFGVLVGALMAATKGLRVAYLGPDLPEEDIRAVVEVLRADLLLLGLIRRPGKQQLKKLGDILGRLAAEVPTWVGLPEGHPAHNQIDGVRYFTRYDELDAALTERNAAPRGT